MNINFAYVPRDPFLDFHQRRERFACLVAHRRAGKTVAAVNELVIRALHTKKKNARYAYIAPFRAQAKNIAWIYLKEAVRDFVVEIRESDLRVILPNGAWITLFGSDNPDALRGLYFDGVVIDEFGDCRPNLWAEVILPTLADRKGWAVVMGTPKGKNVFFDFHEMSKIDDRWFSLCLKASESGIIIPEELENMRAVMTDAQYEQEMECSFSAPVLGTYYAGIVEMLETKGRTNQVGLYDPSFPVHAVCDLGFTDSSAFWFWQPRPDGLAIINYYQADSQPLRHYLDYLVHTGYELDTIWFPHDARAKTLQTGKSTIEQCIEYFKDTPVNLDIVPSLRKQHGIDAARLVLPMCYFDDQCSEGVEALRAYRRRWDDVKKVFSDEPMHDWSSHGSDAFRYLALVCKDRLNISLPEKVVNKEVPKYSFNLNMLFSDRENELNQRRRI